MAVEFSVLIPTYNRADLIAETLDSVFAQTYPAREVIVIDDGSTDHTPEVLARYSDRILYKRIPNAGAQNARNVGFGMAQCHWVALCDSDDLWLPTYLEKQASILSNEPGIGLSFGNFRILQKGQVSAKTKFEEAPPGYWEKNTARKIAAGAILSQDYAEATFIFHPLFISAMVLSKALALSVGGFNRQMPRNAEDGEFTLRCLYRAKIARLEEALVLIRKHDSNISGEIASRLISEVSVLRYIKSHHAEARNYHATIDDQIRLRTLMAYNAAFAAKDLGTVRNLFAALSQQDRSSKVRLKYLIASAPNWIGGPVNGLLQRLR
ncbi:MAG TPA: glycosyltransferase family A protein [Rhizomicrobium sp.]|nr:glycosyltransferase family A protein [Rhizomicrobium sp.]